MAVAGPNDEPKESVIEATVWLEQKAGEMVRASRRTMGDGTAAFPPQVGAHYDAFWLRDFAYMLEGCREVFSKQELREAALLFVRSQRADGAGVDCVKFDGTPIYKPGLGSLGENPVADGSPFTVSVVWHAWQQTGDRELVSQTVDRLVKAMQAVPRDPDNGLVWIKPGGHDRCPYGFTDTVRKQGDVLFCSLLCVQASRQLADLLDAVGQAEEAGKWRATANNVAKSVREVFWDANIGLFRAATLKCREPDVWGSAFAVCLDVATREQSLAVARYFQRHYDGLVYRGQVRHLPPGVYWEQACRKDLYQNGAFWATPVGWFVYTLDLVDPKLADRTALEMVAEFRQHGIHEWTIGETRGVADYTVSAALPLAGIRKMLERRESGRGANAECKLQNEK